jgi:hypothetical protein
VQESVGGEEAEEDVSAVVRCQIFHVTFAEKPHYEAVSYTWGDPHSLAEIILDGMRVRVGKNLY